MHSLKETREVVNNDYGAVGRNIKRSSFSFSTEEKHKVNQNCSPPVISEMQLWKYFEYSKISKIAKHMFS